MILRWRFRVEEGRQRGHTVSQPDLLIAATALEAGLTLVTRKTSDCVQTRVPLPNPWHDPQACAVAAGRPLDPYRSEPQNRWMRRQASSSTAFEVA